MITENIISKFSKLDEKSKNIILEEFLEEVSENSLLIERISHRGKYKDKDILKSKENIIENFRKFIDLSKDKNHRFSVNDIKDCNYNVLNGMMIGGILRQNSVRLSGTDYTPPTPNNAYYMLKDLEYFVNEFEKNKSKSVIEIAAYIHCEIIKIHPFEDGNGRTARALMNYYLLKSGCIPIVVWYKCRSEYLSVNEVYFKNNDLKPFISFMEKLLEEQSKNISKFLEKV